jgi:hypothetical protein
MKRHKMAFMNTTGDVATTWDVANEVEVEVARNLFNNYIKQGMVAYETRTDGKKGIIREFDPNCQDIVVSAPIVGG